MKHIEKAESKHLDKILSDIRDGKYVIPDFQREFEWNPWDVNGLITSIFMDYYIGTLLLWKASDENVRVLSCEGIKGFKGALKPEHIVLDGQQRLTAMYFAFFNPDEPYPKRKSRCFFFMDIAALVDENFEDAFYYQWETKYYKEFLLSPQIQFEENTFPLEIIGRGIWKITDWLKDYRAYWVVQQNIQSEVDTSEFDEKLLKSFNDRNSKIEKSMELAPQLETILRELLSDYNLSYIELDREISVAKVCDIFTNINSKGVPLNIFDLLNAILRPHDIYLKDMWRSVADELDYTDQDKMKIYVFQVMSILEQTYCSSKYLYYLVPEALKTIKDGGTKKQIVLINNKREFETKWMAAVDSLKKSIKALKNPRDFGAITPTFVPYPSIIPAFTAIKVHVEKAGYKNILDVNAKIKKWYWSSIFTLNYSSSVESTSAKDFGDLKKWFDDDSEEPENYIKFVQELDNQDFKKQNQKGAAIYNAIFNILILNEARDWYTSDLPEYETLDDHHIVPHSWGKKNVGNDINSILNKTPLSSATNRNVISDRMPFDYLKEMKDNNGETKFYKILESHLISKKASEILMRNPFSKEDYYEFISEREKTVKEFIQSNIIEDILVLPPQLKELDSKIEEVELKLRDVIADSISEEQYNELIPPHIIEKVSKRIQVTLKKNPGMSLEDFRPVRKKMDYFDLQEYCDVILSKGTWDLFENTFKNKQLLQEKFSKMGELRNSIRHSREAGEVAILEGKAAIIWFNELIK
jgi:hypothetical protein